MLFLKKIKYLSRAILFPLFLITIFQPYSNLKSMSLVMAADSIALLVIESGLSLEELFSVSSLLFNTELKKESFGDKVIDEMLENIRNAQANRIVIENETSAEVKPTPKNISRVENFVSAALQLSGEQKNILESVLKQVNLEVKTKSKNNSEIDEISISFGIPLVGNHSSTSVSYVRQRIAEIDSLIPKKFSGYSQEYIEEMRQHTKNEFVKVFNLSMDELRIKNAQEAEIYFNYIDTVLGNIHNLTNPKAKLEKRIQSVYYLQHLLIDDTLEYGSTRKHLRNCISRILQPYFDQQGNLDLSRQVSRGQICKLYSYLIKLLSSDTNLKTIYNAHPELKKYSFISFEEQIEKAKSENVPGLCGDLEQEAKINLKHYLELDLKKVHKSSTNRYLADLWNLLSEGKVKEAHDLLKKFPKNKWISKAANNLYEELYKARLYHSGILDYSNDPRWFELSLEDKQLILSNPAALNQFKKIFKGRQLLKIAVEKVYDLPENYSRDAERFVYKLIDLAGNNEAQRELLSDIAKDKENNKELYEAFYLKSGILKSYQDTLLAKKFEINQEHPTWLQLLLPEYVNKILAIPAGNQKIKVAIDKAQRCLYYACQVDSAKAAICLTLIDGLLQAINGNEKYLPLLNQDIMLFNGIKNVNEAFEEAIGVIKKFNLHVINGCENALNDKRSDEESNSTQRIDKEIVLNRKKDSNKPTFDEIVKAQKEKSGYLPMPPNEPDEEEFKKKHPNGRYEDAPYHHQNSNGLKNKAPKDGQTALDNSFLVKEKGNQKYQRRIGISENEFVVLDETGNKVFHGHIREWHDLTKPMRDALIENKKTTVNGKVL